MASHFAGTKVDVMHRMAWLVGAIVLQSAATSAVVAQAQSKTPRVFIEGFRATDSLTRHVAAEVRAILPGYVSENVLSVMPTSEIDLHLDLGEPDDFGGGPWNWADLRHIAMLYRVDAIVDIVATPSSTGVTLDASRLRPPCTGSILPLPTITAATLKEAAQLLARRLATDSILLEPVTIPPSFCH